MVKYVIAICSFICCAVYGYSKANALRQRFLLLVELTNQIGRMAENIKMLKTPVPKLLKTSENSAAGMLFTMIAKELEEGRNGNLAWVNAYKNAKQILQRYVA